MVEIALKTASRGKRQPWFTKEIAGFWRQFHKAELQWLQCKNLDERRILRKGYLEKRKAFRTAGQRRVMRIKCVWNLKGWQSTQGSGRR